MKLFFYVIGFCVAFQIAVLGQTNPIDLGPAAPYNGFFFEHFTARSSDVQGRLAIGHTGSLNHYSVGDQLNPENAGDVLVVGGNLAFPSGRVYFGNIVVGGQASAVGNAVINGLAPGATLQAGVAVPVDFPAAAQQLTQLSQALSRLSANTTFQSQWGGLYLHGDGSSQLQVFQLPGDLVIKAHTFQVDDIPDGAWVVFNIDGEQAGLTNMSLSSLQPHRTRVVFNFFEATNLKLRGIAVEGSVLAPLAHVANPQGVLHGQIVAKSWNGPMQLNHVPFEPFDSTPANQPPEFIATPVTQAVATQTYSYTATASDPDGDVLTFSLVSGPDGMTIDATTGQITWTPTEDQVGDHPVTLRVEDPDRLFDEQSYTITVIEPPNHAPIFTSTPNLEATSTLSYSYQATASDPDDDVLAFSLTSGPAGLTVDPITGLVSWSPGEGQVGDHPVTLHVEDPEGLFDTQTYIITVTKPPNRAPTFTSMPITQATATLAYIYQAAASDPDGDALTFLLTTGPAGLTVDPNTGSVSWSPGEDQVGDHPVTLRVEDPDGLFDTQRYTISVAEPPNRAPVFTSTPVTAATATLAYNYQASASDPDGDVLNFSLTTGPAGLIIDAVTGQVTWTLGEDQVGDHVVTLRVEDPEGLFDTQSYTISVAEPPNHPPVFTSTPVTAATATLAYNYQASASDPDGDALVFTLISGPAGLTVDPTTGLVSWTPEEKQVGDHVVTLQVSDPNGLTGLQDFLIDVTEPPNRAPVFTSSPVLEAVATRGYPYTATASDPDDDALTFSLVSGPDGMTIEAVTGQITWIPDEDQVGDHPVTLRVADPDGLFDTQSYTITVAEPPNRAPAFTSTPVATATLRELYLYTVTATDPDGDDLSFAVTEGPVGMFIDPVTGDVTWTPADDQGGNQLVTLRVSDPDGLVDTQSFQITVVTPENRPPRITSTPVTPHLLSPVAGDATVFDLSTWTQFTYTQSTLGQPRWTFNNDFTQARQNNNSKPSALLSDTELDFGQISCTLRVDTPSDDDAIGFVFGWQDPRNFYLFEWRAGSQQLGLGLALQGMSLKVMHSDPQLPGEAIVAPTTPDPADGQLLYHNDIPWQDRVDYEFTLEVHPGQFTVTVRRGATVLDSFTLFDATHGQGKFGFYNFSQEQVVYRGFNQTVAASREYRYDLTADDPDGDALQWTLLEGPEGLSLDPVSSQMDWLTTTQDTGTYPIRIRVEDGQGGADEQSFNLVVSHEVPVITSQAPPVARAGALYIYDVGAVDPDPAATFTFALTQAPPGMAVETVTGRIAWTPEVSQLGTHTVTVQLTDDQGHIDSQTFEVTVVPLGNQPPVVTSTPDLDATLHVPYHYQTNAFDPDGDALLYLLRQGPKGMQIDPLTGFLSWDPQPLQVGSQQIRVEVWDTAQNRTLHAFTLELANNAKPAFTSTPPITASEGVTYSYAITTSDPDGDAVSLHLVTGPLGMTLDGQSGMLQWTPDANQAGPHPALLEARDVHQAVASQAFTITVAETVDGRPTITSIPGTEAMTNRLYTYAVQAVDPEGLAVTYGLDRSPSGMTIDATTGLVTWTPTSGQVGFHEVTVTAIDPGGNVAAQPFAIRVATFVNTPPEITSTPVTEATATLAYSYQVEAEDVDGDPLTFAINNGPAGLTIDQASGLATWTPTETQVGDHSAIVEVTDGAGGQDSQSFVITVSPFVVTENALPEYTSEPPGSVLSIGETFSYIAVATDADGDTVTYSLEQGPVGLTVGSLSGQVQWPNAVLGSHLVVLVAADGRGGLARQSFTVNVQAHGNSAPTITSNPSLTAEVGVAFEYEVTASDPDGFPFFFHLDQAPAGATIAPNSGVLRWTPTADQVGNQAFTIRVADPLDAADTQSFTVAVSPASDREPPFVAVNVLTFPADPDEAVTVQVVAGDANGLAAVSLTIDGSPVTLDAQNEFVFSSAAPGAFLAKATATDLAGNAATAQGNIFVRDPADGDAPTVTIHAPLADSVLTAPTEVTGTVQDASLVEWRLAVGLKGEDCFTTIATGTTEVIAETLGTLDPTLLPNGLYELRLSGTDTAGRILTDVVNVVVEGGFKVGRFTIGFRDLDWPLKGLPAQVNRIYDSTRKCPGDFGIGWDLADVRVQISAQLGEWWDLEESQFCVPLVGDPIYPPYEVCNGSPQPLYCVQHTRPHYVTVTLPDGKTEVFDLVMDVEEGRECMRFFVPDGAYPTFVPRPGTTSKLSVTTGAVFFRQLLDEHGNTRWTFVDASFEPWDPQLFELETEDGVVYRIHRTEGVQAITDLEGNSVTIHSNGISHSSGETIQFVRNAKGFIEQVIDPAGNTTHYNYDEGDDLVAVTDPEGNTVRFRYDAFHNLTEIQDPTGNIPARNEYDAEGRLVAQVDGHGNRIRFDHDITGRQELVYDAVGNLTVHVYDERGNVLQTTNPLGETTLYTYDARDNELTKTIAAGTALEATTTRTYDGQNRLLSETDPLGHTVSYSYDDQGRLLRLGDTIGDTIAFTYDSFGRPTQILGAVGEMIAVNYLFEDGKYISLVQNPLGNVTRVETDAFDHIVRKVFPEGKEFLYTTDLRGNVLERTQITGSFNSTWSWTYDKNGRELSETNPLGHVTRTEYDGNGQVIAEVDARGYRTEYDYDARGNKVRTRYPDGAVEVATWDARGNQLTHTDRLGRTTRFDYDLMNRLVKTINSDGTEISETYDAAGGLATVTDALGQVTRYEYDLAGRRTLVVDAIGGETNYIYDTRGNQIGATDANGHTTTYIYDAKNRRIETVFPDGTSRRMVFDALDRQIMTIDQAGQETHYNYDPGGNLSKVTDAMGNETRYVYDEQGNRTEQIDALGRTTRWAYDPGNRAISRTLPLGMSETMGYDAAGNLIAHTDFNGQLATMAYDALNRRISRTDADGVVVWTYNQAGLRESVSDARGETHYNYDLSDRLARVDQPEGTWLAYEYDANGNRTAVVGPNQSTSYSFDALNRLDTVTDDDGGITSYGYDAVGNRTSLTQANGVVTTYAYDALNRLVHLESLTSTGTPITRYAYSLAPTGHRTRVVELGGRTVDYSYDDLYRLTEEDITDAVRGNNTIVYTLDAVGNRLTKTDSSGTVAHSYDANDRIQTAGTDSFSYDANGNTLTATQSGVTTSYSYDAKNRLTEAVTGSSIAAFAYDADGLRVAKQANGETIHYLVDSNRDYGQVLEELDGEGQALVTYTHGDDLLSQDRAGDVRYFHADGHGSVVALTDPDETITDTSLYDAFGQTLETTGATESHYGYTGEQHDPDLGFLYLRARYYNPTLGRFHTQDTWLGRTSEPLTLHKYLYANADPINRIDPGGHTNFIETLQAEQSELELSIATNIRLAFQRGGATLGRFWQAIGNSAENLAWRVLLRIQNIGTGITATQGIRLANSSGRRWLDFLIRARDRLAIVEVKYSLPSKLGPSLTRIINQMEVALTHAQSTAQSGITSQVVLWSLRAPDKSKLDLLLKNLGENASSIQIINGVQGLYSYLNYYFFIL